MSKENQVIRVVIVDGSPTARDAIKAFLKRDPKLLIVGEASSGQEAVVLVRALKPELLILDMETPLSDGLEAIETIVQQGPVPILVVVGKDDLRMVYSALQRGAAEVLQKPVSEWAEQPMLLHKIRNLADLKVFVPKGGAPPGHLRSGGIALPDRPAWFSEKIVVIASSLGGPLALGALFSRLPSSFPWPILAAQHISDGFAQGLADWLNRESALDIQVATPNAPLLPGQVLINPPEYNMSVNATGAIRLHSRPAKQLYHPSCDHLLTSAAAVFGERAIGIILTGMGQDGAAGMKQIKKAGGVTLAQDEKSCTLFGMPKVAIESGCVDRVLPVEAMAEELLRLLERR
jgi:two-component system chemotaxis response regulator CheB